MPLLGTRPFWAIYMSFKVPKCQSQDQACQWRVLLRSLHGRWHLLATEQDCSCPLAALVFPFYGLISKANTPDLPVQALFFSRANFTNIIML